MGLHQQYLESLHLYVHGEDNDEQKKKQYEKINARIKKLIKSKPEVGHEK